MSVLRLSWLGHPAIQRDGIPVRLEMRKNTDQYLSRVLRSCGQTESARAELEKVRDLPQRALVYSSLYPAFESDRVRCWLAAGDTASAEAWVRDYQPGKSETPVNREIEQISLVRVRLASDASPAAREQTAALLEELARGARAGGRIGALIEILVLKARSALLRSQGDDAVGALDEALRLGQPRGYFQTVREEGLIISETLKDGLVAGRWSEPPMRAFVESLIS